MPRIAGIKPRRGTTAEWAAANAASPPRKLADGELGYDTTTKDLVVGDGSTAFASLPRVGSGTYARLDRQLQAARAGGPLIGWCGDSWTVGTGASSSATMWTFLASTIGGGLSISQISPKNAAGGWTAGNVLGGMDAIIAAGVKTLFVLVGINDSATALATWQSQIQQIKAKADAAGIPIAFGTIPPRGDAYAAGIASKNMWLRYWCGTNGIPLADVHGAIVNPSTGLMNASYNSGDNVHINDAGHLVVAQTVAPVVAALVQKMPWPVRASLNGGLLSDPLMATQYGGFGWLAGYSASVIESKVAPSGGDLPAGQWQRYTATAPGSQVNGVLGVTINGWSAGDKLAVFAYVRGSVVGALAKFGLLTGGGAWRSLNVDGPPVATPGPVVFTYTVPAGTSAGDIAVGFQLSCPAGQTRWVDVGAMDVFNLTSLGVDLPY